MNKTTVKFWTPLNYYGHKNTKDRFELYVFEKVHHVFDMSNIGEIFKYKNGIFVELPQIHLYQCINDYSMKIHNSFHLDMYSYRQQKSNILQNKTMHNIKNG